MPKPGLGSRAGGMGQADGPLTEAASDMTKHALVVPFHSSARRRPAR